MTVALVLRSTLLLLLSLAHVVLATLLFSAPVPLRGGWGRVAVALGALAACHIGISALLLGQTYESSEALFTVSQFGTYSILLVACVAAFVFAYDTSVWTALFCCSAGYTVQNLSSGATELAWFLVKGSALLALLKLVHDAGASVVGAGIVIEKAYQPGGDIVRGQGVRVESLARIASMDEDGVKFVEE